MYKIMQSVIHAGGFKLEDMRHKVNKMYIQGELTEEQADQLLAQAEQGATPDAERPELLQIVRNLSAKVDALAAEVAALKNGSDTTDPDDGATEYESWTPWDGISDKYQPGAIVSHILGLNAVEETLYAMEKPNGAKKVCYNELDLPLSAIDDLEELGKDNELYRELAVIVKRNGGMWCAEAEKYLLAHAPRL